MAPLIVKNVDRVWQLVTYTTLWNRDINASRNIRRGFIYLNSNNAVIIHYLQEETMICELGGDEWYLTPLPQLLNVHSYRLPPLTQTTIYLRFLTFPINPSDINQIEGVHPVKPIFRKLATIDNNNENENEFAIAGNEGVAEVIAVGDQLNSEFKVGDWVVMGKPGFGTWCTHAIANGDEVTRIPNGVIGLVQAATLTVNPCSAYRMLKDFVVDLKENDFVIQNGANSGVGQSIIQIANAWGIKTINIVRNRPDIDELKSHLGSLGATHTATDEELSHSKFKHTIRDLLLEHKNSNGIRLGSNCIGGKVTTDMVKHLSESGYVVTYGAMSQIVSLMKDGKLTDVKNEVTVWGDENDNDETLKGKFFAIYDKAGAAFSGKKQIIKLKNTN
ncbi:6386_t:CDS:2 [Entrophospora sp. SA101]|nr:6386_t:CDS:2 [Entrophospora sp. SA101]